ncbi:hypothetical protein TI05_19545, partial [Achromatium sp. WMS3]
MLNEQATRGAVLSALKTFQQTLERRPGNSTVLFAFSGHGQEDKATKKNFLLTYDTYANAVADTGLSLDQVTERLQASKAPRQIAWIDACRTRDNPL